MLWGWWVLLNCDLRIRVVLFMLESHDCLSSCALRKAKLKYCWDLVLFLAFRTCCSRFISSRHDHLVIDEQCSLNVHDWLVIGLVVFFCYSFGSRSMGEVWIHLRLLHILMISEFPFSMDRLVDFQSWYHLLSKLRLIRYFMDIFNQVNQEWSDLTWSVSLRIVRFSMDAVRGVLLQEQSIDHEHKLYIVSVHVLWACSFASS